MTTTTMTILIIVLLLANDKLMTLFGDIIDNTILLPYTLYKKKKAKAEEAAIKKDLESFFGKEIDLYRYLYPVCADDIYRVIFKDGSRTDLEGDTFKEYLKSIGKYVETSENSSCGI